MSSVDLSVLAFAGILLIPFAVFWLECWLAFLPRRERSAASSADPGEVWIVIPAHDEAPGIAGTLRPLCRSLLCNQHVLVVADNCSDDTARIAREQGCRVIERSNPLQRGKGFALQFAFDYLQGNHAPSIVIVLDADCRVAPFTISRIAALAHQKNRPVQALNLSEAPLGSHPMHAISELGFRFKNLIRPLGLSRAGLPCQLMGTGMAIPWTLLQQCRVGGDDLTEDMNLGVELALLGHPALFHPSGLVLSKLPQQSSGFMSQRTRWEQGHLRTSLTQIPALLSRGFQQRSLNLFALAFDLTVPPFSLLMLIWAFASVASAMCWQLGFSILPLVVLGFSGVVTALTILCCWWKFCRQQVPFSSLLCLPYYVMRKVPIYVSFVFGRTVSQWVRTEREVPPTLSAGHARQSTGPLS